jgi:uncharacterized protein (UPF0332 family)
VTYADDLLEQAAHLCRRDSNRPKQANLNRAVSAAYYALFHELTSAASALTVRGSGRDVVVMQRVLARAYDHRQMKSVSEMFARAAVDTPPRKLAGLLERCGLAVTRETGAVAGSFVKLQEERHSADYDLNRTLTREAAEARVGDAAAAVRLWRAVSGQKDAEFYLLCLGRWDALKG